MFNVSNLVLKAKLSSFKTSTDAFSLLNNISNNTGAGFYTNCQCLKSIIIHIPPIPQRLSKILDYTMYFF